MTDENRDAVRDVEQLQNKQDGERTPEKGSAHP